MNVNPIQEQRMFRNNCNLNRIVSPLGARPRLNSLHRQGSFRLHLSALPKPPLNYNYAQIVTRRPANSCRDPCERD